MRDLVYWLGFFIGIIGTFVALEPVIEMQLVRGLIGLVVGIGLGFLCERTYAAAQSPRRPPGPGGPNDPDRNPISGDTR
jgi:hypothetical protein